MRISPTFALLVSVPLVAVLSAGSFVESTAASHTSHLSAVSAASAEISALEAEVRGLTADAAAAEASVAAASGRVLDASVLDAVSAQVAVAAARATAVSVAADLAAETVSENTVEWSFFPWELESATNAVTSIRLTAGTDGVESARAALAEAPATVAAAVTAWEVEQARLAAVKAEEERLAKIAAEKAAAEAAAAAAEAKARAARPGSNSAAAPAASASRATSISVNVRTNVTAGGAYNGQDAIDGGGQVGIFWPGYGTVVSAHNFHDSRALNLRTGDLVTFTGAQSGTFRVSGAMDVPKVTEVSVIGALGVSMYMQTCYFDGRTMRVVGLVPA